MRRRFAKISFVLQSNQKSLSLRQVCHPYPALFRSSQDLDFFPCKHEKTRVKNAKLVLLDLNGKKLREHECEYENRVSDLLRIKLVLVFVLGSKALSHIVTTTKTSTSQFEACVTTAFRC